MPWKECSVMEERLRFVARLLEGEEMSGLCREFGISRKTGYKLWSRYKDQGLEVKRIGSNIVVELATETVLAHSHRALRGHPQSSTQPGVAILGDVALTTGFTRL